MIRLDSIKNSKSLSVFLSQCQQHSSKHIGYIGTEAKEIQQSLENEFSDLPLEDSALGIFMNEELIGFLGFDLDKDDRSAEIWGPYFKNHWNEDLAFELWKGLIDHVPMSIEEYSFFINSSNKDTVHFAKTLGATFQGNHLILTLDRSFYEPQEAPSEIKPFELIHKDAFIALHQTHFPGAYLTADEMIESIDPTHRLLLYKENESVIGYIYAEVSPQFGESDIHFFAVDAASQGKGVGTQLLHATISWIFSFSSIQTITLCVSVDSVAAIHLYKQAQFKEIYALSAYDLKS
ncbi:GNAT family N-acetyltransferase [Alkalihalobacillus sp. FSL W8-0930]